MDGSDVYEPRKIAGVGCCHRTNRNAARSTRGQAGTSHVDCRIFRLCSHLVVVAREGTISEVREI